MALDPKQSIAAVNAALDAKCALLDGGTLKIYTAGSGIPAATATAISDQVLLATLTLGDPAFNAASGGVATAIAFMGAAAVATGTAAFFRLLTSADVAVFQGTAGTSGCDCNRRAPRGRVD